MTHHPKFVDRMCKYEMDQASIMENPELAKFCPQMAGQTAGWQDSQMDGQIITRGVTIRWATLRYISWYTTHDMVYYTLQKKLIYHQWKNIEMLWDMCHQYCYIKTVILARKNELKNFLHSIRHFVFLWSMTLRLSIKLVLSCLVSHLFNKFKLSNIDWHDWRTVAWAWTDLNHLKQHFWHDYKQPPFLLIDWNVLQDAF